MGNNAVLTEHLPVRGPGSRRQGGAQGRRAHRVRPL